MFRTKNTSHMHASRGVHVLGRGAVHQPLQVLGARRRILQQRLRRVVHQAVLQHTKSYSVQRENQR